VENDIRAAREARLACWAAADARAGDAVDEGGCGERVAGLEGRPAGGICLEEGGLGVGGVHFFAGLWGCVCVFVEVEGK
jgi:hypothetical protein